MIKKEEVIVDPEIITKEEYKTRYPADNYDDTKITQAISQSYEIINYKYTANEIGRRWDLTPETGGFSNEQKKHIKYAFLIQSRYLLQIGLNAQKGTYQRSNGSQNVAISIPQRDAVYETVIYCLEQAGLTTMFSGSSVEGNLSPFGKGCFPDIKRFVTWDKGNLSYAKTQYTDVEGKAEKKNKLPFYDEEAIVEWLSGSEIATKILPPYQTGKILTVVERNGKQVLSWTDNLSLYVYNIKVTTMNGQNEGMSVVFELLTTDGNLQFNTIADIFAQYDYVIETKITAYNGISAFGGTTDLRENVLYCRCLTQVIEGSISNELYIHSQNITAETQLQGSPYVEKVQIY